ncbi:hypothetical protein ACFY9G_37160 [Streptomyces anthocyanicus]|uniref:Adhesin n=1 Tax=Streptomyces violaceolatus TaxID=67378 RepID=A0ABN3TBA3_9ACTN|nr:MULTISPECIES: hypothetical protein [Streptomyces]MDX3349464.1 hypothetical protein [Streptomyces sp. ME02-6979A]
MIEEDWKGFATAFDRAVRPSGDAGRSSRRILVIGCAMTIAAAIAALINGVLGGPAVATPDAVEARTEATTAPTGGGVGAGGEWTAVAGPSCASEGGGSFTAYGYYTGTNSDQTTGWTSQARGGYSGGSCTGGYLSMPVSGDKTSYDDSRFALWKFDFSRSLTSASCRLDTYVPKDSRRDRVGGDPAYYYYYQSDFAYGSNDQPLDGYRVAQVSEQGHWVRSPAFKVRTGRVTVKLVNAGAKDTAATRDAHVAVAQVKITCHAV